METDYCKSERCNEPLLLCSSCENGVIDSTSVLSIVPDENCASGVLFDHGGLMTLISGEEFDS